MANLMQALLQEAQRTKRLIKAAPGHIMDQFLHYNEDFKETSKQTKQHISQAATSGKSGIDEAKVKKAIEEAASNAIPGGGAAAGIFGGAGRQDLALTRGISLSSLLSRIFNSAIFSKLSDAQQNAISTTLRHNRGFNAVKNAGKSDAPIMRQPSLAIHATGEPNPFQSGVTLVMNPNYFDPATTARSKLYNRDIYSKISKAKNFFKEEWHGKPAALDPRLTEGLSYDVANIDHWLQVLASPKFKSFAEYEASKAGAGTLDAYKTMKASDVRAVRQNFRSAVEGDMWREFPDMDRMDEKELLNAINEYATYGTKGSLTKTGNRVVDFASKMPSDYAELKYSGNTPMNAETLLGIIMHTGSQAPMLTKAVSNSFPGVPLIKDGHGAPTQYIMDMLAEQIKK